jgi:hypothetical protein
VLLVLGGDDEQARVADVGPHAAEHGEHVLEPLARRQAADPAERRRRPRRRGPGAEAHDVEAVRDHPDALAAREAPRDRRRDRDDCVGPARDEREQDPLDERRSQLELAHVPHEASPAARAVGARRDPGQGLDARVDVDDLGPEPREEPQQARDAGRGPREPREVPARVPRVLELLSGTTWHGDAEPAIARRERPLVRQDHDRLPARAVETTHELEEARVRPAELVRGADVGDDPHRGALAARRTPRQTTSAFCTIRFARRRHGARDPHEVERRALREPELALVGEVAAEQVDLAHAALDLASTWWKITWRPRSSLASAGIQPDTNAL